MVDFGGVAISVEAVIDRQTDEIECRVYTCAVTCARVWGIGVYIWLVYVYKWLIHIYIYLYIHMREFTLCV